MRQTATPLPASVPGCEPGHHPQLVTTHGAPVRHALGGPMPPLHHVECCRCQVATRPHPSRAIAESRWTDPSGHHRIPLSQITRAREEALAALADEARAA